MDSSNPNIRLIQAWREKCIGLIAQGHEHAGNRLLSVLGPYLRDQDSLRCGMAIGRMQRGDYGGALQWVNQEILAGNPTHVEALVIRMECLRALGDDDWERAAKAVLSLSDDPASRSIVSAALAH